MMDVTRRFLSALAIGLLALSPAGAHAQTRLSFTSAGTPSSPASSVLEAWAAELSEATGGALSVEFYYQQSLSKLADNLEAIASGLADMGIVVPAYSKKDLPLTYLSSTSYTSGDPYVVAKAWMETRSRFPQIAQEEERAGLKFLAVNSIGPVLFVGDRHYVSPDDFDGATMRLSSHYSRTAQQKGWNVSPARIRSPETYTALEKGTITGSTTYANQIYPFRLNEVADHVTILDLGQHMNMIYMSLDTWERLSQEERAAIEQSRPKLMLSLAEAEIGYATQSLERAANDPAYPMKILMLGGQRRQVWADQLRQSYERNVAESAQIDEVASEIADFYTSKIEEIGQAVEADGYPWSAAR